MYYLHIQGGQSANQPAACELAVGASRSRGQQQSLNSALNVAVWQPPEVLSRMEPYVADMHKKSGLMPRIEQSRLSLAGAEKQMMELMTKHCAYGTAPLCGNTIGQDRRFIVKYMPQVDGYLSHPPA